MSLKSKNVNFKLFLCVANSSKFVYVPPYKSFIDIISSPGLSNKRHDDIAAIPLENTTVNFPFSNDAMHLSNEFLVLFILFV